VANATVMVIMDADRFGISQLHQLRGRVGRGTSPGLCLLVTETESEMVQQRLLSVAATNDGFTLARLDLEHRREGDVLGAARAVASRSFGCCGCCETRTSSWRPARMPLPSSVLIRVSTSTRRCAP